MEAPKEKAEYIPSFSAYLHPTSPEGAGISVAEFMGYQGHTYSSTISMIPGRQLCKVLELTEDEYGASTNGRLERWISERFRIHVWSKILLSELRYIQLMKHAMKCQTAEDATSCLIHLGGLVLHSSRTPPWTSNMVELGRSTVGDIMYFAGYYDFETRMRVERVFGGEHPICGNYLDNGDSNEHLLKSAGEWERMFVSAELEEEKRELDRLREESTQEVNDTVSHHSNKVKRRNVKKLNKIANKLKDMI